MPSFGDDEKLKHAILSALQSLSQSGCLGINPFSFSTHLPVPDSAPHKRGATGGDGGHQPHTMGGPARSSGVGACSYLTTVATTPIVQSELISDISVSGRPTQVPPSALESCDSLPLGFTPSPLGSLGTDQLRVAGGINVSSSVSSYLSPSSLLFPLPDSGFSSLTSMAVSSTPSLPSSVSSSFSSAPLSSSSSSSSFPLPSFAPSSLYLASFPSSSHVSSALPPSISSVLDVLASALLPPPPFPLPSSDLPPVPPPHGFLSSSFFPSSSTPSFFRPSHPPSSFPAPPLSSSSFSTHVPFSSSSSSSSSSSLDLVAYCAHLLGLSNDYQSLARWFVHSGGVDFPGLVRSSYPHLLVDLVRNFASGSSLFLAALSSPAVPSPSPVSSSFPFPSGTRESPSAPPFSSSVTSSAPARLYSASMTFAVATPDNSQSFIHSSMSAPAVAPPLTHPSAPSFALGSLGADSLPFAASLRFPLPAHAPPPGFPLAPSLASPQRSQASSSSKRFTPQKKSPIPRGGFRGWESVPYLWSCRIQGRGAPS